MPLVRLPRKRVYDADVTRRLVALKQCDAPSACAILACVVRFDARYALVDAYCGVT